MSGTPWLDAYSLGVVADEIPQRRRAVLLAFHSLAAHARW